MIDGSDQAQAFAAAAARRPTSAQITSWLPDHLHVLRETVEAEIVPGPAAVPHLLILTYLLCAEMFARQLTLMLPPGGAPR